MWAVGVTRYKSPLEVLQVPAPEPGEHDVLIDVEAAGLNQLDEKIRAGEFRPVLPYTAPFVLGHDVAGTVVGVGPSVSRVAVGDTVWSRPRDGRVGTFAEQVAVHEDDVALAPTTISTAEAGSLPLVALTAWQALVEVGQVQCGQKVLIHAGTGGVGTVAIQLAKHLGAEVATTVSGRNADFVRKLGADHVVDYRSEDFSTGLSGYDLVLDSLGAENVAKSLQVLKPGGVAIGISGPPTPQFAKTAGLNPVVQIVMGLLSRKVRKLAAHRGVRYHFLFMRADGRQLDRLAALIDEGVIRPVTGKEVTSEDIPGALATLGTDGTVGKTVAVVDRTAPSAPTNPTTETETS